LTRYAYYKTAFGILKIGYSDTAVELLTPVQYRNQSISNQLISCPNFGVHINMPSALSDKVRRETEEFPEGRRMFFDFPCECRGTEFEKKYLYTL
jgi:hypothetical protein